METTTGLGLIITITIILIIVVINCYYHHYCYYYYYDYCHFEVQTGPNANDSEGIYWGYIGILENKMETTRVYRDSIGYIVFLSQIYFSRCARNQRHTAKGFRQTLRWDGQRESCIRCAGFGTVLKTCMCPNMWCFLWWLNLVR